MEARTDDRRESGLLGREPQYPELDGLGRTSLLEPLKTRQVLSLYVLETGCC